MSLSDIYNFYNFRPISFLGIALIALGTGGIKPCVVSFGADQFKVYLDKFFALYKYFFLQVPEQAKQMATYFAMFYASINLGSMVSTIATPYLRYRFYLRFLFF